MKNVKIRWGILGTGVVARQFAEGLSFLKDAELYAVGARSKDKAEDFARIYPAQQAYGSFEELVCDANIDVVYVATPHHVHRDHCILSLLAGKPILCEKPFAINAEQADEVISLAREKNLFCMEAMWMRFIPLMRAFTTRLANNVIGDPCMMQADFGMPFMYDSKARQFNRDLAGGALLDLGVYPVSLSYQIFGAPCEIVTAVNMGDSGVDETSSILLKYPGGKIATLQSSVRLQTPIEAVIMGSAGTIRIKSPLYRPHKMMIDTFTVSKTEITSERNSIKSKILMLIKRRPLLQKFTLYMENYIGAVINAVRTTVVPFVGNGYNYEAAEVMRCLREGKLESEIMPLDETVGVLKILDEIRNQWGLKYSDEKMKMKRE